MNASALPLANHISMVSLGVEDLLAATEFYQKLGWKKAPQSQESISFMIGRNIVLGLYGRSDLAKDAGVENSEPGFSGIACAINFATRDDVDSFAARVQAAEGEIVKPPQEVFWGGYSGYFRDHDQHLWEIAHNPFAVLGKDGQMLLEAEEAQ